MALIPPTGAAVALIAAIVAALGLARGAGVPLLGFALAALAVAVCIWLVLATLSALRKAHDTLLFREGTWWRVLFGGHALRMVLAVPVALWSGVCICLMLAAEPLRGVLGAALVAVLVPVIGRLVARRVDPVIVPGQQARFVLPPVIAVAGMTALVLSVLSRAVPAGDLAGAVAAAPRYTGSSALLGQVFDLYALGTGLTDLLRGPGPWGLLAGLVVEASVWFGLATALSLMLLPRAVLGRILAPAGQPRPVAVALSGFVALVLVATLLQSVATLEGRARVMVGPAPGALAVAPDMPGAPAPAPGPDSAPGRASPVPLPSDLRLAVERERIGSLLCPPGTIARLDAFEGRVAEIYAAQQDRLESSLRGGFDAMRANVPAFLDWYYSLGAEYLRTINLLIGSGEDYLRGQITDRLNAGAPFLTATAEIAAIGDMRDVTGEFEAARRAILADCGGDLPLDGAIVTVTAERAADSVALPVLADRIALETRLAAAGFGGLAAGVGVAVLAKVGAKVAVSSVFKAAAAALAKIAGSKALSFLGGAGLGALAGGTGGSVVPGAGTTAGALVGGVVGGVAVMLGVDFTLIKLEEEISRAGFEAEILAAIDATEAEFLAAIGAE